MAIGRISGPLLKANLVRDGVDLAFETDLLYLDVTNSRIGVNTPSPTVDLDVNGTIKTNNITVSDSLTVGDLTFTGNSITSSSTISFLSTAGQATIYHSKLQIDDLQIYDNTIATNISNSNIELVPNGTGIVDIQSDAEINGDLDVNGNITATGNVTIGGNIILGNEVTDTVTINARISSDIIPDVTDTYDIGTPTARWRNGYFNNFSVGSTLTLGDFTFSGNTITSSASSIFFETPPGESVIINSTLNINDLQFSDNVISTTVSNSSIDIRPNGVGTVELEATTNITGDLNVTGSIDAAGNLTVDGNATIGQTSDDILTINSNLVGSLIPDVTNTYDLGSSTKRWGELFVTSLDSSGLSLGSFEFVDNTITSSESSIFLNTPNGNSVIINGKLAIGDFEIDNNVISTVVSNSSIDINPNGTGTVELEANTRVTGNLSVTGNITTSTLSTSGTVTLGGDASDTLTINARILSSLIPIPSNTHDLGSVANPWLNVYTNNFSAASSLTVGNITFFNNTISTTDDTLIFNTTGGPVIFNSGLRTGDISVAGNLISTIVSNSSIDIRPSGSGTVELEATTNVTGDLNVTGDIVTTGSVTVNGNTVLGDNNSDTITINSELVGDLIPTIDNTYDIGSSSRRWNTAYYDNFVVSTSLTLGSFTFVDNTITSTTGSIFFETIAGGSVVFDSKLAVGDFEIDNNVISTTVSNSSIDIRPNGTGTIELEATTNVTGDLNVTGNITAQGNITIGGNVIIGDSLADTVTFNASIQSDLIPETTNTYDLGSSSFYWKTVYTDSLYTNSLNVPSLTVGDIIFTDNEISTTAGEDLLLDGNGSGGVQISNFLFSGNTITNVVSDAISVIAQTGTGYFKIDTTNGFVVPVGTTAERPSAYAVVGMTRYNTQLKALEIWDGAAWASPAGSGGAITEATANDISAAYALILG